MSQRREGGGGDFLSSISRSDVSYANQTSLRDERWMRKVFTDSWKSLSNCPDEMRSFSVAMPICDEWLWNGGRFLFCRDEAVFNRLREMEDKVRDHPDY